MSEDRLRQSNLSNLSYIYYRTDYGIRRSAAQTDADNRFKLTPRRWIRYRGGRSFLIIRWELRLPLSNRCSTNAASNFSLITRSPITSPNTVPTTSFISNKFLIGLKLQEQFTFSIIFYFIDYSEMRNFEYNITVVHTQLNVQQANYLSRNWRCNLEETGDS